MRQIGVGLTNMRKGRHCPFGVIHPRMHRTARIIKADVTMTIG
jgi:hypothetical protein